MTGARRCDDAAPELCGTEKLRVDWTGPAELQPSKSKLETPQLAVDPFPPTYLPLPAPFMLGPLHSSLAARSCGTLLPVAALAVPDRTTGRLAQA